LLSYPTLFRSVVAQPPEVDVRSGWDFFAGQAFGASEEARHLRSGDVVVRTETVVRRGVAAAGDTCRSERIDILFEDRAVVVVEAIRSEERRVGKGRRS